MSSVKPHPRDYGFALAISVEIDELGVPSSLERDQSLTKLGNVAYVAIRAADEQALKIGIARDSTLWQRWSGTLRVVAAEPPRKLRPNEWEDQRRWRKVACGHRVEVWAKSVERDRLHAEEDYIDHVFSPALGKKLIKRRPAPEPPVQSNSISPSSISLRTALNAPRTAYGDDFYSWTQEQGALLRAGRFDALDLENVAEEIESLGRGEFDKLVGFCRLILLHMLRWEHQPNLRSVSWATSIDLYREEVADVFQDSPGLRSRFDDAMERAYRKARLDASNETDFRASTFPENCPFTREDVLTLPYEFNGALR